MTAAVVLVAAALLAAVGVMGWLARRHVLRVEAHADELRAARVLLDDLADQRDAALGRAEQAVADLRAVRKEQEIERATHARTVTELKAALEVIRERTRADLVGATDDAIADVVVGMLRARVDAHDARAADARGGDGAPRAGDAGVR